MQAQGRFFPVELRVELVRTYSNQPHLLEKYADLRKRISESPSRSLLLRHNGPPPRSKRFLNAEDIADIVRRYEAGETTQHIGNRYGISKTRVATVLREQGITIRRQGLTEDQVTEAARHYAAGKSLAWLAAQYDVSHTTVAAALREQGVQLRQRPGWR
jgi:uncharacterized protein (DUF433 family)